MTAHAVHEHRPLGGRIITVPFLILCVLALIGGVLLAQRFLFGIGAVANVNDGYAWGIWVVIDVVVGTAFGCAGYAMALLVYILNRGEYHPLVRPALLASLFGYTLGGMAVVIDLGRYWNAYNLLLPGQINLRSVMFEISVCVAAYIIVLWIEFAPAFLERLGLKQPRKSLSRVLFLFIGLGVLLPTMHQSSLGTMLTVLGHRLDPLWQTQLLPLLFLISALVMGFAIVVFEAVLASVGFKRPAEAYILGKLAGLMAWLVVA
jgi:Ni/Fe-hydrogenase subunit HybB-like protein